MTYYYLLNVIMYYMMLNLKYVYRSPNKIFSHIKMSDFYLNKWIFFKKHGREAFATSNKLVCFCPVLLPGKCWLLIAFQNVKI